MGYKIKNENDKKISINGYYPDGSVDQEKQDEYFNALAERADFDEFKDDTDIYGEIFEHNENEDKKWERNGKIHLQKMMDDLHEAVYTGHGSTAIIGERIMFLRQLNHQSQKDVYEAAGISRSTFARYESGDGFPKLKTLKKIINALFVTEATFAYEPNNFDKWKESLISTDKENDVFKALNKLKSNLEKGDYTYRVNGNVVHVPQQYLQVLRTLADAAEKTICTLPHDDK